MGDDIPHRHTVEGQQWQPEKSQNKKGEKNSPKARAAIRHKQQFLIKAEPGIGVEACSSTVLTTDKCKSEKIGESKLRFNVCTWIKDSINPNGSHLRKGS